MHSNSQRAHVKLGSLKAAQEHYVVPRAAAHRALRPRSSTLSNKGRGWPCKYRENRVEDAVSMDQNKYIDSTHATQFRPAADVAEQEVVGKTIVQPTNKQFNWFKCWYPLALVNDLDPAVPHPLQLLGIDLVVWRDKAGEWRAFRDRCPHRLAALSEGRIDHKTGDLYCNYHGWQFGPSGACTAIPQMPADSPAVRSKRSCVDAYPTLVREQLLWVWPDCSPTAAAEAAAAPAPGVCPEIEEFGQAAFNTSSLANFLKGRAVPLGRWYIRYCDQTSWLAARENTFNDPSHDNVAHHGLFSLHRDLACTLPITLQGATMDDTGYAVKWSNGPMGFEDAVQFPACTRRNYLNRSSSSGPFSHSAGIAYITPTAQGKCFQALAFLSAARPKPKGQAGGLIARLEGLRDSLMPKTPLWLEHINMHYVVDADLALQHGVDVNRGKPDSQPFYMPNIAVDRGVMAFRKWLNTYGAGGPPVATLTQPKDPAAPLIVPREQLLDRYHSHTKHCKACSGALANFRLLHSIAAAKAYIFAAAAVAVAALAAASYAMNAATAAATAAAAAPAPVGVLPGGMMLLAVSAVLGLAAAGAAAFRNWCESMIRQFVFVDYDHHCVSKQP